MNEQLSTRNLEDMSYQNKRLKQLVGEAAEGDKETHRPKDSIAKDPNKHLKWKERTGLRSRSIRSNSSDSDMQSSFDWLSRKSLFNGTCWKHTTHEGRVQSWM